MNMNAHNQLFRILFVVLTFYGEILSAFTRRSCLLMSSKNPVFGRFGSVQVDIESTSTINDRWGRSGGWPEGIRLANNIQASIPKAIRFHNVTGYPYAISEQTSESIRATNARKIASQKRTYSWQADELIINCRLSDVISNPTCTRITPPISWLSIDGARTVEKESDDHSVDIHVPKSRIENNLLLLRMFGLSREDIFRMLDKGPWILAFDITAPLAKLSDDLHRSLGLSSQEQKHVISHCPYLLAQYARYKGRDICATAMVLREIGYSSVSLIDDIMRFPSILTTPPSRLRGWMSLLETYDVATRPHLFGKMLRRAAFMFHLDPPYPQELLFSGESQQVVNAKSSEYSNAPVVYEAVEVLDLLSSLKIPDLDKVIRTQPNILLCSRETLKDRIHFLLNLFSSQNREASTKPSQQVIVSEDSDAPEMSSSEIFGQSSVWTVRTNHPENDAAALETFHELLLTYPGVLSVEYPHLKAICNSLRASGLTHTEIIAVIKSYPHIFKLSSEILYNFLYFLKSYCGFRKSDIAPSLIKYPCLYNTDVETLKMKVDYLYQSLGGSPSLLRRFPAYLSYDLDEFIRPRAEFLRTFNKDPVSGGLAFLLKSPPSVLADIVNVKVEVFEKFCKSMQSVAKSRKRSSQVND